MYIGILTVTPLDSLKQRKLPSYIKVLKNAALELGHKVKVVWFDKCQMVYGSKSKVLYSGKKFPNFDVVIPRIGISNYHLNKVAVVKQLQMMGIPVVNSFLPILRAKDKLRTMQILSYKGIPIPKTVVVSKFEYIDVALKKIGKMPVIIKTTNGSLGVGVAIIESKRSLVSALDVLWSRLYGDIILIQEYIRESEGKDIRVFVVGGKIVAAMQRTARKGDFRSNIHQGGTGASIILTPYEKRLAINATNALGLDVAGVDLLEKKGGSVVMEVNCNPGLEGITSATGINVAAKIIEYAVQKAKMKKTKVEY